MTISRNTRTAEQNEILLGKITEFIRKYPMFAPSAVCSLMGWSVTTMNATIVRLGQTYPVTPDVKRSTIKDYVFSMFEVGDLAGIEAFYLEVEEIRNFALGQEDSIIEEEF